VIISQSSASQRKGKYEQLRAAGIAQVVCMRDEVVGASERGCRIVADAGVVGAGDIRLDRIPQIPARYGGCAADSRETLPPGERRGRYRPVFIRAGRGSEFRTR
jgi:hypothetical protein